LPHDCLGNDAGYPLAQNLTVMRLKG
jgi:hypothetical protein